MVFDTAIVGTGPAAISAALTLKLHKKNIVWFGSRKLSPKVEKSEMIANYPGAAMVTGPELNRLYQEQIARAGLEITERQVTNILANRRGFMLQAGDEIFDAKTVLLATGSVSPTGFPGEAELLGHGVSYCATCDGFLYPGKAIAVYCGSREFEHEVIYLAEIAAKVYLFTPYGVLHFCRSSVYRTCFCGRGRPLLCRVHGRRFTAVCNLLHRHIARFLCPCADLLQRKTCPLAQNLDPHADWYACLSSDRIFGRVDGKQLRRS